MAGESGPISPASRQTVLLLCSLRFDFTAPRAGGTWQGKLFFNNGFKKKSWKRNPYQLSLWQTGRRAGRPRNWLGRSRGTGVLAERWGLGFSPSSASHRLALWPWAGALSSLTYSFLSVP